MAVVKRNPDFLKNIPNVTSGENWSIVYGDCLEVMKKFPEKSIDLVITSPPYNLGNTSGGGFPRKKTGKWSGGKLADGYGSFSDNLPKEEYVEWQKEVLLCCWNLLTDTGAIFYNHKPRVQNGLVELPTDWNPGLPLRQIVIWKRSGGINFSPSHYLPMHEYVLIYAKKDFRLKSKQASGVGDVWEITQEKNNPHAAPFPLELTNRILETLPENKIVLDPFSGSATTGLSCLLYNSTYIGIEIDQEYVEMSAERLRKFSKDIFGRRRKTT